MEELVQLTNLMLAFDHVFSYRGLLALCHHLYLADIDMKLELVKVTGWRGCVGRLLVQEVVQQERRGSVWRV